MATESACVERKTKTEKMNIPKKKYHDDDLLSIQEVCVLIGGISPKTLADWNNNHKHRKILAPICFTEKVVRYEYKNVKAFIEKCRKVY
ncbi:hypothetical protein [Providencia rettgeri]|uniref:hypothetical protein n=1 Tax=Providencia rettgeri TaxID=587 RepID=UPI00235FDB1E|nr:hypothetical protein [Providencia rettgeri]